MNRIQGETYRFPLEPIPFDTEKGLLKTAPYNYLLINDEAFSTVTTEASKPSAAISVFE